AIFLSVFVKKNSFLNGERESNHIFTRSFQDTMMEKGKKVFQANCSACHRDSGIGLAPGVTIMSAMTPRSIVASLKTGKMRQQGSTLSETERVAVAQWLTKTVLKTTDF